MPDWQTAPTLVIGASHIPKDLQDNWQPAICSQQLGVLPSGSLSDEWQYSHSRTVTSGHNNTTLNHWFLFVQSLLPRRIDFPIHTSEGSQMSNPVDPSRASVSRTIPGILFGVAILVLALGNCSVDLYPYGMAVWVRPLFSMLGIAGAILLFVGSAWWRVFLPIWCLLQTWIVATDVSGPWFYQGLMLGHFHSQSVKANEVLVEYEACGVNYAGLVLLMILAVVATLRLHPAIRFRITSTSCTKFMPV